MSSLEKGNDDEEKNACVASYECFRGRCGVRRLCGHGGGEEENFYEIGLAKQMMALGMGERI